MRCPYCGSLDTQVKDSRPTDDSSAIRRRRICPDCGGRFTTFERVQLRELMVLKKSGRRVPFDRDKLERSVQIALRKRAVDPERESSPIPLVLKPGRPVSARLTGVPAASFTNGRVRVTVTSSNNPLASWTGAAGADGRFVWPNAPEGLLRISVNHPDAEYASFTAPAAARDHAGGGRALRVAAFESRAALLESRGPTSLRPQPRKPPCASRATTMRSCCSISTRSAAIQSCGCVADGARL